jgi:hypothetical protein
MNIADELRSNEIFGGQDGEVVEKSIHKNSRKNYFGEYSRNYQDITQIYSLSSSLLSLSSKNPREDR